MTASYNEDTAMAKDQNPIEDFNLIAKRTMEQAQGAAGNYLGWLQKSMSSSPWGDAELGKKLMTYAERNISATFEFVQKLSQAKDFQDLVRIQSEFMQAQLQSFGEQAKDIGEASTKAVADAMKTKSPSIRPPD
jgi:phasin